MGKPVGFYRIHLCSVFVFFKADLEKSVFFKATSLNAFSASNRFVLAINSFCFFIKKLVEVEVKEIQHACCYGK
ncbi:MAG: hypothetical protein RLZZ630_1091 [Bacteroidota bacterium]|jgi:hypothetical protein